MEVKLYTMDKILFLDRDGVINQKAPLHHHILSIKDFIILPRVKEALELAKAKGYIIIVITNQRSVPKQTYDLIHNYMLEKLPEIDSIYVCPHENGECDCRKPLPGLFYQVELKYNVDKINSVMIGDSQSDIDAATNYGIKSYLTTDLYSIVKECL